MTKSSHVHEAVANAASDAWLKTNKKIIASRSQMFDGGAIYPVEVTLKGEPRIEYIKRLLESLLKLGTFTKNGEEVVVDGFLLKNVDHWAEPTPPSPEEILDLLSERCEVKCEFCYLRMNPDKGITKFNPNKPQSNLLDINLRIELFRRGKRLFAPTFELEEILGNKNFKYVASKLRSLTTDIFYISTTGASLSADMIEYLASIEPVELRISLNAINPAERFRLMRDRRNVVLEALRRLHEKNMRFSVSIVIWPNIAWEEIVETIKFADQYRPYMIVAILPGYTEAFSEVELFDTEQYWFSTTMRLSQLRFDVDTPLVIHPRLYEENVLGYPPNVPLIIGVVPGSPAWRDGVLIGDLLIGIDDFNPIYSRRQLDSLLVLKHRQCLNEITFHLQRDGKLLSIPLDVKSAYEAGYPHKPPFSDQFGIQLISQGISISDLRELARIAKKHDSNLIGVATSDIVLPSLLDMIKTWKTAIFDDIEVVPFIPKNAFFGGNIRLGELCTASDYISAICELVQERPDIKLVAIPSPAFGPGGWWRDLAGVPFTRIQRETGVCVELLICAPFE